MCSAFTYVYGTFYLIQMYVVVKNLNIRYKYFSRIKSENLRLPELHRKTKHSSNSKSYIFSIGTKFVFFYYTVSITKDNGFFNFELYVVKCVYMLHIFYFVVVTSC